MIRVADKVVVDKGGLKIIDKSIGICSISHERGYIANNHPGILVASRESCPLVFPVALEGVPDVNGALVGGLNDAEGNGEELANGIGIESIPVYRTAAAAVC